MKFRLEIDLGSEAMSLYQDVIGAVTYNLENCLKEQTFDNPLPGDHCRLTDHNGRIVGKWEVIT